MISIVEKSFIEVLAILNKRNSGFNYLKEHICDNENIELINNKLYIINKKYLNQSNYKWLCIYDNDKILGFQLILEEDDYIELCVIQKCTNILNNNIKLFEVVITYIINNYNKDIITFPENNKLKEYYKKYGFVNYIKYNNYLIMTKK